MASFKRFAKLQIKALYSDLPVKPKQLTNGAAGFDVYNFRTEQVAENIVHVYLGFAAKPPRNFKIVIVPRSSITKTNWIMQNSPGIGDEDYRGEYQVRFRALPTGINFKNAFLNLFRKNKKSVFTYDPFPDFDGRCAQIFLEKVYNTEISFVSDFDDADEDLNRTGGFGSTNK